MLSRNNFVSLSDTCFLKELEQTCVYNVATDELYEVNSEAFAFLKQCDGSKKLSDLPSDSDFLDYCLEEGLLVLTSETKKRPLKVAPSPLPSLRYLELQITDRCNLRCKHCYLGPAGDTDLPWQSIMDILQEFEQMQGLRILLSGGEPLLHPEFWAVNEVLPSLGFRSILLSNGTLLSKDACARLKVHEVQVSLDGLGDSHDRLRGHGSFARALSGIENLKQQGIEVSIATMVHKYNVADLPKLEKLVQELEVREWNVDVPCFAGRLSENPDFCLPYREAASFLGYGYGGGLYSSAQGHACGTHLCAVMPDGKVAKCGFFANRAVGTVAEGLATCWQRIIPLKIGGLNCQCSYLEECRGGCRYRALLCGDILGPDPVQCYVHGAEPPT